VYYARMFILLLTLCGSYVGLTTLIISLSVLLDKWYNNESKQWLALHLKEGIHQNPETWLRTINQTFLDSFDRVFGASKAPVEQIIWIGLLLSPLILAWIQIPSLIGLETPLFGDTLEDTSDLLIFAMSLAFTTSFSALIGRSLAILSSFICLMISGISSIVLLVAMAISTGDVIEFVLSSFGTGFFIGLQAGILVGLANFGIGGLYVMMVVLSIGAVIAWITTSAIAIHIASSILQDIITVIIVLIVQLTIAVFSGYTGLFYRHDIYISVHPLKALGSSLGFIILVSLFASLIRADAATSFFAEMVNGKGVKILAFVAFNMFADGISLLETRWVLQRGSSATAVQLLGLLVLDLVASAAIFLFLPAVLGEITTFWSSILLQGDRPWLGILFWSTFGTSVIFYLFFLASLLVHPLIPLLRGVALLSRGFKLEEYPFGFIALSLCLILTLIFAIGGLVALIAY
jgi:hypothetical protein